MDILKKASQSNRVVVPGEESLHKEYNMTQVKDKKVSIVAGIDGGSTGVRISLFDPEDDTDMVEQLESTFAIPSISTSVPDDRRIVPKGGMLYDIMDSSISNLSGLSEAPFQHVRLVRGEKAKDVELKENRMTSSVLKVLDPTFYFNVFDIIGYSILNRYEGAIPEEVNVTLGVALPPNEDNEKNLEFLHKNLVGCQWRLLETGTSIKINIERVLTYTEPEAFINAYYLLCEEDEPEVVLHIEGGGRSVGTGILVNGVPLGSAQVTLDYGGTQLKNMIAGLYVSKYGGRAPRESALDAALKTGLLKVGNSYVDIVPLIKESKDIMAQKISDELGLDLFDQQTKVGYEDLNVVSVSGQLFASGDYDYSLAKPLAECFAKLSPNTEFKHIEGNFIPQGLAINVLTRLNSEAEAAELKAQQMAEAEETPSMADSSVPDSSKDGENELDLEVTLTLDTNPSLVN